MSADESVDLESLAEEARWHADAHDLTNPSDFPDFVPAWMAGQIATERLRAKGSRPRRAAPEPTYNTHTGEVSPPTAPVLTFRTLADVAEELRTSPPPLWLMRRIWPADAYGILGAEDKAGKTWAMLDLAVAVAGDGSWCGRWKVDAPGPVLVFVGEGSYRKMLRRLYAIGTHHGMTAAEVDALPIRLCERVPNLTDAGHVAAVMAEVKANPPRLVILDPLYLAAGNVDSSQLNKMGAVLGTIQHVCTNVGAALIVAHHWNKTGEGTGRKRFTGAGTAEWGRVLVSMSVLKRRTEDPQGVRRSVVDLRMEFIGDEIADEEATFRRTVWTDDADDLTAPMHYRIEPTELDPAQRAEAGQWDGPTECMAALRHFFSDNPGESLSKSATCTRLRGLGLNYRTTTISDALERLAVEGALTVSTGARKARVFSHAGAQTGAMEL
jgi:hypothetical protein